ncbi:uncharacterized protein [Aristolochia californica]|uniref:uncharacterized protein n=1 Tax=Aristolochia californica TaxID=171875 RepID=UPI0035E0A7A2
MGSTSEASKNVVTRRERFSADENEDLVDCSGKSCRSCSGNVLADCVAVCCCPCAVVNLLVLAFIKVPWAAGKRCVGVLKRKRRVEGWKSKRKIRGIERAESRVQEDRDSRKKVEGKGDLQFPLGSKRETETEEYEWQVENFCAGRDAERVWMELYQIGHLGFGRVSFTGTPGKSI